MPIWDADSNCPLCGQTQDRWGDHALSCLCGGDRVGRHNAVRDVFHNIARDSCSLTPIKEKPGLLPPRAPDDGDRPFCLTLPTLLAGTSAAPLTSGSPTAPQVSPRPGTSPSGVPSAPSSGPEPIGTQARCSSTWSLASPSSTTTQPVVPAWVSSSDPLSSRPSEVVGPAASASCPAGSPASLAVPPPSPPPTPASLSLSASQQPFTGKMRGRSSSAPLMISHSPAPALASRSSLRISPS